VTKKGESNYAGKQPRITPAEKQQGANKPRPIKGKDAPRHPGYPGKRSK